MNKGLLGKNKTEKDFVPAYYRLQKALMQEIEAGRWEPGANIPPERLLAETHKVSIGTVKRAILNLVNEGYLYRVQGSGTFVAGTNLRRESLRYYRFLEHFRGNESSLKIQFVDLEKIHGIKTVNQYLKIRQHQLLYRLKRILITSKRPIIYTISYLPQKMFPKLEEFSKHKFERIPIFISLERSYGLPTIFNRELFGTALADGEISKFLKVRQKTPVLLIEMLAYTYQERPYEYRQSYCLSDSKKVFREW